jgi:hypothetical protein
MPLRRSGDHIVYATTLDAGWISGIAFSKNIWNHAKNSGYAFTLAKNGGSKLPFPDFA